MATCKWLLLALLLLSSLSASAGAIDCPAETQKKWQPQPHYFVERKTIEQAEREALPSNMNSEEYQEWLGFKNSVSAGDEIWLYSYPESFPCEPFCRGFVLIRDCKVVATYSYVHLIAGD